MKSVIATFLLISSLCWCRNISAQEGDSRTFYEKNYAAVPQVGSKKLEGDIQPRANTPRSQDSTKRAIDQQNAEQAHSGKVDGAIEKASTTGSRFQVDLYANSVDRTHFEKALNALIDAAKSRPIDVKYVHQMGDYRNITQPMKDRAAQVGLTIIPILQLPEDLPVERSPAWVITTPEGRYILEGVFNISRFINESGEFTTAVPRTTPRPTIGMGDF